MRNLPKREYKDDDIRALFDRTLQEYIKAQPQDQQKKLKHHKFVKQIKLMFDTADPNRVEAKSRGYAYVEMSDPAVALHCLRALNNTLVGNKRLIIDFALEDQRKLLKRNQKRESFFTKMRSKGKSPITAVKKGAPADKKPGEEEKKKKKPSRTLDKVNNPEELKKMLDACKGRGKRQRISKKLVAMGVLPAPPPKVQPKKPAAEQAEKMKTDDANKDEPKLAGKRRPDRPLNEDQLMEKDIVKARKQKRQKKRDARRSESDKFEECLEKYKKKIIERLEEAEGQGDHNEA